MAGNSKPHCRSFFKVLIGDLHTKLRVPPAFVKNLKRIKFPTEFRVNLKADVAVAWKVKMERCEGGCYFTEGWGKVAEDLELAVGDFLVFYLVEVMTFEVAAYDPTCCEKEFGFSSGAAIESDGSMSMKEEEDDDDEDGGKDEDDDDKDENEEHSEEDEDDNKEEDEDEYEDTGEDEDDAVMYFAADRSFRQRKSSRDKSLSLDPRPSKSYEKLRYMGKPHKLKSTEKSEALLRAKSFRSGNPYFVKVMQPSYLYSVYILLLPSEFLQMHVPRAKKTGELKLLNSDGMTWKARYHIGMYNGKTKARLFWKAFAQENNLVVGDVCVFELMGDAKQISFKVTICREL